MATKLSSKAKPRKASTKRSKPLKAGKNIRGKRVIWLDRKSEQEEDPSEDDEG